MPTSQINQIPKILGTIATTYWQPKSVLDVGCGYGKYGMIFREILTYWHHLDPRIDAIEGCKDYIGDLQYKIYDKIYIGNAIDYLSIMDYSKYDLVLAIDILEHFDKCQGHKFLLELHRVGRNVLVSTPKNPSNQNAICDNELEMHRSRWTIKELCSYSRKNKVIKEKMSHIVLSGNAVDQLNGHYRDKLRHKLIDYRDKVWHPVK